MVPMIGINFTKSEIALMISEGICLSLLLRLPTAPAWSFPNLSHLQVWVFRVADLQADYNGVGFGACRSVHVCLNRLLRCVFIKNLSDRENQHVKELLKQKTR